MVASGPAHRTSPAPFGSRRVCSASSRTRARVSPMSWTSGPGSGSRSGTRRLTGALETHVHPLWRCRMRSFIGSTLVVVGLTVLPSLTLAQRRAPARTDTHAGAQYEFGVDLGADYAKPSSVNGVSTSGGIELLTPVDIRVGFRSRGKLMWEPRVSLGMTTWGGATRDMIGLGVSGLYAMDPSGHSSGMYLTGGAGLVLVNNRFYNGTNPSIGGGGGFRKPFGSAAGRYELGFPYDTKKNAYLPATIPIGGRVGLSLWH